MKATMLTTSVRSGVVAVLMLVACPPLFAAETVAARDLGIPVTSANLISYRAARGWGHEGGDLLCWVTTAESGGHFSAMDLGSGSVLTCPLNHLEGYPIVFGSDRRVYVGSTSGEVLRWTPRAKSWAALGKPLFAVPGRGVNHVRALCEGPGGWLYAGSCTGERARIHLDTAEIQKLPEPAESGFAVVDLQTGAAWSQFRDGA